MRVTISLALILPFSDRGLAEITPLLADSALGLDVDLAGLDDSSDEASENFSGGRSEFFHSHTTVYISYGNRIP